MIIMQEQTMPAEKENAQKAKIDALLHLADDSLIMGHRCSEWCGHGPILEQDIALTNIALDFVGQARNFYQHAAALLQQLPNDMALALADFDITPASITEDSLAYLRNANAYKNHLLVELPNGDWAQTILKIFFFSNYRQILFQQLLKNSDTQLAAIAEKSLKEIQYHVKWSGEWVMRLGDGTDESRERMLKAIDYLWPYVGEFFNCTEYEKTAFELDDTSIDLLKQTWLNTINHTFQLATLPEQTFGKWYQSGGKLGIHTEHLGYILAEMQFLPRTYPNAEW
ncbi:ring-1,2-phenylacetyl-CoA epoxidase subunit PaaC [Hydrotalea sandarakina]|uniref:Ring-1,2-phenylacetyl-CoA epoxidase subunit PaaC n=2 Tax=Hydrotalea sandarakina TaxID=1004304 RepID=A0A2W7RUS5_9BACT|nr:ring-1,2-phenylacetyl-CoA epoxidase subunit PaaC [Hydrotalea sandarakina]